MKTTTKTKLIALALAPAAMLAFTACNTTTHSNPFTDADTYQEGVPGGAVVNAYELNARVTAIDAEKRLVTLLGDDGQTTTVKCGPDVRNFDQIRVGDRVAVKLVEAFIVAMGDTVHPLPEGPSSVVLRTPQGDKPGGIAAETSQVTAKLTGIDTLRHHVTLHFPDDTIRTYAARKDVDIDHMPLGQDVVIRNTTAIAIWVKTP